MRLVHLLVFAALLGCGREKEECRAVVMTAQEASTGAMVCANTSRRPEDVQGIVSDMNASADKYEAAAKAVRAVKTSSAKVTDARDALAAAMETKAKVCRTIGKGVEKRGTWFGMQPDETKREFQPWEDAEAEFNKPHDVLSVCGGFK